MILITLLGCYIFHIWTIYQPIPLHGRVNLTSNGQFFEIDCAR